MAHERFKDIHWHVGKESCTETPRQLESFKIWFGKDPILAFETTSVVLVGVVIPKAATLALSLWPNLAGPYSSSFRVETPSEWESKPFQYRKVHHPWTQNIQNNSPTTLQTAISSPPFRPCWAAGLPRPSLQMWQRSPRPAEHIPRCAGWRIPQRVQKKRLQKADPSGSAPWGLLGVK